MVFGVKMAFLVGFKCHSVFMYYYIKTMFGRKMVEKNRGVLKKNDFYFELPPQKRLDLQKKINFLCQVQEKVP